jgi:uncharacterized protein (DUF488 family)
MDGVMVRTRDTSDQKTIWTIGHSTSAWPMFLDALTFHHIATLVDVRTYPGSRRYPHFNRETMERALRDAGVTYAWMPLLGGRRRPAPDSKNTGWRNAAFRGYADYMDTPEFADGLQQLETLATAQRVAIMCSEAVWWRCHRGLISDALKARGWNVLHILGDKTKPHPYTPAARIENGRLSYREKTLF